MLDREDRDMWRKNWIDTLEFFANQSSLGISCLERTQSLIDRFSEVKREYFERLNLQDGYLWALEEGLLTQSEFDIIKDFHEKLLAYTPPNGEPWDYGAILSDPTWDVVCDAAKTALNSLLNLSGFLILGPENKCLDLQNSLVESNNSIVLNAVSDIGSQLWEITTNGLIVSTLYRNKCLEVEGGLTSDGTPVVLSDVHGGSNQRWVFTPDGLIISVLDQNKCLDVRGGLIENGTPLILSDIRDDLNQRWKLAHNMVEGTDIDRNFIESSIVLPFRWFTFSGGISCSIDSTSAHWVCGYQSVPPGTVGSVGVPIKIDDPTLANKVIAKFKADSFFGGGDIKIVVFSPPTSIQFSLDKIKVLGTTLSVAQATSAFVARNSIESTGL